MANRNIFLAEGGRRNVMGFAHDVAIAHLEGYTVHGRVLLQNLSYSLRTMALIECTTHCH